MSQKLFPETVYQSVKCVQFCLCNLFIIENCMVSQTQTYLHKVINAHENNNNNNNDNNNNNNNNSNTNSIQKIEKKEYKTKENPSLFKIMM